MREWFWHILTPLNALPFGFACVFVYIYIFPYFFGPGKACASFFFSVFLSLPHFRYCQGYSNFSLNEKFTSTKTIHPCAPVRWRQTAIKWFPHPPHQAYNTLAIFKQKNSAATTVRVSSLLPPSLSSFSYSHSSNNFVFYTGWAGEQKRVGGKSNTGQSALSLACT